MINNMCGTFTSILGQAAALMVVETVISPSFGVSEMRLWLDFALKGIATFWIYKYAQCSGTSGTTSKPLAGLNAMTVIVGGLLGAATLLVTTMFLPSNRMMGGMDFLGYIVQAVVLNFVYGMGGRVVADLA